LKKKGGHRERGLLKGGKGKKRRGRSLVRGRRFLSCRRGAMVIPVKKREGCVLTQKGRGGQSRKKEEVTLDRSTGKKKIKEGGFLNLTRNVFTFPILPKEKIEDRE